MKYDIDAFVNVHSKKVGHPIKGVTQAEFEKCVNFDRVNSRACPVYVYELQGDPVAWYDAEFEAGYVV